VLNFRTFSNQKKVELKENLGSSCLLPSPPSSPLVAAVQSVCSPAVQPHTQAHQEIHHQPVLDDQPTSPRSSPSLVPRFIRMSPVAVPTM
jgi:hypothetical protein